MKPIKILLFLLLFLTVITQAQDDKKWLKLTIKVEHFERDTVTVSVTYFDSLVTNISSQGFSSSRKIAKADSSMTPWIPMTVPRLAKFKCTQRPLNIFDMHDMIRYVYLPEEGEMTIFIKQGNHILTDGKYERENRYLDDEYFEFLDVEPYTWELDVFNLSKEQPYTRIYNEHPDPYEYKSFVKKVMEDKLAFLEKEHKKEPLDSYLYSVLKRQYLNDYLTKIYYYGRYHPEEASRDAIKDYSSYFDNQLIDYFDEMDNSPFSIDSRTTDMFQTFHSFDFTNENEAHYGDNAMRYKFASEKFAGEFRRYALDRVVYSIIKNKTEESPEEKKVLDAYFNEFTDEVALSQKTQWEAKNKLKVGVLAPEIEFTKIDGTTGKLSDYRGSLVYIDFWGSWCGPCLEEIPHSKKLHEDMKKEINKGKIVFLNIARDSEEDWKKTLKKYGIENTGVQALGNISGDTNPFVNFNISSYPTYIVIGKDGKILNLNMTRPSSASWTLYKLKEYIKQN